MKKFKSLEEMWNEVGWKPSVESWMGYIICHFEQLHLGTRHVIAVNINVFPSTEEGMQFINKCCKTYNSKVIYIDKGEVWLTRQDNAWQPDEIPSRFSDSEDDHILRGAYLGYGDEQIRNYFEE